MPRRNGNKGVTSKKKGNSGGDRVDVAPSNLVDLGDGKQSNEVFGEVESSGMMENPPKRRKTREVKKTSELKVVAEVEEGEELMEMAVNAQDESIFTDEGEAYGTTDSQSDNSEENSDIERQHQIRNDDSEYNGSVDPEVSFNNNAHGSAPRGRMHQVDERSFDKRGGAILQNAEVDDLDDEEMKSMMKFANFLQKQGFLKKDEGKEARPKPQRTETCCKSSAAKKGLSQQGENQGSVTTIYQNAVQLDYQPELVGDKLIDSNSQRLSSSSEELVVTSDEAIQMKEQQEEINELKAKPSDEYVLIQQFLDYRMREQRQQKVRKYSDDRGRRGDREHNDYIQPSTSQGRGDRNPEMAAQQRSRNSLRRAEDNRAHLYQVPGKNKEAENNLNCTGGNPVPKQYEINAFSESDLFHSVIVDEEYTVIGNQIDEQMKRKILAGEYVNFSKLLVKDRVLSQQDVRMEMVNRNGMSFWVPINDRDSNQNSITSFGKWQQAFRVYTTIYVEGHPHKAKELMQYSHVIYSASLNFVWENVYAYDIDFRLHLSKYPRRNWGIILNQAWTLRMKDRVKTPSQGGAVGSDSSGSTGNSSFHRKKICWKYNSGECTYGFSCKFDHRCGICGKHGHGAHICHKAKPKRNSGEDYSKEKKSFQSDRKNGKGN